MKSVLKMGAAGLIVLGVAGCGGASQPTASESTAAAPVDTSSAASTPAVAANAAPADFAQCQACHSTEAGKTLVGPSLAGVFGRKAGSVDGFAYSDGVKALGVTWDEANLDKWLTNPAAMAAGTKMTFPGIADAAKRKAVIDYLKTLK